MIIALCTFALTACEKNTQKEQQTQVAQSEAAPQEIKLGNKFVVVNELTNKNMKIQAFETSLTGDGKYYYQIEIQNLSQQPVNLKSEQMVLVDEAGAEFRVKLLDRELTAPFEVNETKKGIVAFDEIARSKPKYLKFKDA